MRHCLNCKKSTANPKFCSLSCSSQYNGRIKKANTPKRLRQCKYCSLNFEVKDRLQKFCNHSCAASYNNAGVVRNKVTNVYNMEAIKINNCLNCGKELHKRNQRYTKCCSKECAGKYRRNQTVKAWLDNPDSATQKHGGLSATIRQYLLEQSGYKCSECGSSKKNPYSGKYLLEINHIDGDSRNNNPDNLEVLCLICHGMTKNYRALNKNSTRIDRRTKYHQAKLLEEILANQKNKK